MAIFDLWKLLRKDPKEWHTYMQPATEAGLMAAERALAVRLPLSYRKFLRLTNGAILFREEHILGVGLEADTGLDLAHERAVLLSGQPPLPPHLLPFAPTGSGVDCFALNQRSSGPEYPVVFWDPEGGEGEVSHESFDEWLFELTESLREMSAGGRAQSAVESSD